MLFAAIPLRKKEEPAIVNNVPAPAGVVFMAQLHNMDLFDEFCQLLRRFSKAATTSDAATILKGLYVTVLESAQVDKVQSFCECTLFCFVRTTRLLSLEENRLTRLAALRRRLSGSV